MPDFLHPGLLTLGLPILAVPILIHLINLMRHRRVRWAAMEFLLESQKKNSTWILLKQLLLLLLRVLAVAAIVLIVAQPRMYNQLARLLGETKTHHIVLLDDSYSMSDRFADTSAFARGKRFVSDLAMQAARRPEPQTLTLLRFSRAGKLSRGRPPDLLQEIVNSDLVVGLEGKLKIVEPSQTDAGPASALESIEQLFGESETENRVVYLVSDFRAREWNDAAALNKALAKLNTAGAQVRLIQCVDGQRPNLAVTALQALPGTRAAGVPLFIEVGVTNFGAEPAREVAIALLEDGRARPGESIEEILPGRTELRRFLVQFTTAGEHSVSASVAADSVEADNARHAVVDFPVGVPVLLVDGDVEARDGYFLSTALNPGMVRTGLSPQIEQPRFLNNNPLDRFTTIYLANIDRLDPPGIEALEKYVRNGGGVALFVGELTSGKLLSDQLYRHGEGLLPLPLTSATELLVNRLEQGTDLEVAEHPIFRIFAGERNSFLGEVNINRYFAAPENWVPNPDSTVQVIARLRNGAPLAVEQKFGEGRVVAFLTTAAPVWNNWGQNPSFVVTVQELQAYLSSVRPVEAARRVASPLELRLDPTQYQPQVRFIAPGEGQAGGVSAEASVVGGGLEVAFTDTDASGIYRVELTGTDGTKQLRQLAYNVPPDEGDLKTIGGEGLAERLRGVQFVYQQAENFQFDANSQGGFSISEGLLYLMIVLLIGEQILAYSASYHPPVSKGAVKR